MHRSVFHNQLNKEQIELYNTYSQRLLDCHTEASIDKARTIASSRHPEQAKEAWFISLHDEVKGQLQKDIEAGGHLARSMLTSFIISVETQYQGVMFFLGNPMKRLDGIRDYDINAPHMEWIKNIDRTFGEIKDSHPDSQETTIWNYASALKDIGLSFEESEFILKNKPDSYYAIGAVDWAEWYVRSKEFFDENGNLSTDKSMSMGKTLSVWSDKGSLTEDDIYYLLRNHDIHPLFEDKIREFVSDWAKNADVSLDENSLGM